MTTTTARNSVTMSKHTVIIRNDETKNRALSIINNLLLDPAHEMVIRPYKVNLSAAQRKQYFLWCGVIGDDMGNPKDEQHLILKKEFLIPIFAREHEGFDEMLESLRRVYRHDPKNGLYLMDQVVKLTSITDASVAEMREYMNSVDHWSAGVGIRLPVKDDLDQRAWHR